MARRLKVFSADMGFVRAIVAAPSQKAALEAWGVRDNLFARGAATEVHDPDLVKEATVSPGEVLRKPIAAAAGFLGAAKVGGHKGPKKTASAGEAPQRKKPPPSRKALEAAETRLKDREDAKQSALDAIDAEQAELDARRERAKAKGAAAVKSAQRERDGAKAAYDRAFKAWGNA